MKKSEIRKKIRNLFKTQNLGILATLGKTFPYQSIVAFAASPDLKNIMFTTNRMTSKYRNLKNSTKVSMFIDNRTNKEEDFQGAIGLTALGNANELQGSQRKKAMSQFIRRHPGLKEFVASPESSIFIVKVNIYSMVMHFQEVIKVRPDSWE
ncbi:MAG TPA: flavin-nucleotide-binding protein [Lentisphaeria bacterium]|nr:flavin-nucleotide-binding protein [Lentisphaeria bacterium]